MAARILENVRLPLVVVNENTDVSSSDLSITDVEFTNVDLLAMVVSTEITTLVCVELALVAIGEDVNDSTTDAVVTFTRREELAMWMTDVMFILTELADDTTLLDGRIKELGSEDGVTKEIILFADPPMLVIIGIEVFNIGTVLLIDKLTVLNGEMVELSDGTTEIKVGAELSNKMSVLVEIILLSVGTTVPNAAVLFN